MDETIKIYSPKRIEEVKSMIPSYANEPKETKKEHMSTKESYFQTMTKVVKAYEEKIRNASFRHPWFNLMYNWIIAGLLCLFIFACISWGLDIRTNRIAEALTATAMADYQAEQRAQETARLEQLRAEEASIATIMRKEAEAIAPVFYGIRNFEEKYHYSDADFMTYARVIFNRVENPGYGNSVEEVVKQPDQWVGYFDSNPVLEQYYTLAYKAVEEWHNETTKPVANDFVYAELTPNGIFLKNDFHADGYAVRWKYGR